MKVTGNVKDDARILRERLEALARSLQPISRFTRMKPEAMYHKKVARVTVRLQEMVKDLSGPYLTKSGTQAA